MTEATWLVEQYSSIFPGNAKIAKIITQPINSNIPLRSRANVGLAASGYVFLFQRAFSLLLSIQWIQLLLS